MTAPAGPPEPAPPESEAVDAHPAKRGGRSRRGLRILFVVCVMVVLAVAGHLIGDWFTEALGMRISPRNEHVVHRLLMLSAGAYTLLIAVPFVPGVEIALSLLMLFGPPVVALMYVCTLLGLGISFTVGRLVPVALTEKFLADIGFRRAARFLARIAAMSEQERLNLLVTRAPGRWAPLLIRFRYVALALAVNIPGNSVIGGGGGIAFVAGLTRIFSPVAFFLTLAIAISPVPLAVLAFGEGILLD